MPNLNKQEVKIIHYIFDFGLILKGINGILEIAAGILLYFFNEQKIVSFITFITNNELTEDPNDKIANFVLQTARALSLPGRIFASLYFFSHGIIKLGLIAAMLKKKSWSYPLAMVVFGLFIVYQMYKYFLHPSAWLVVASAIDVVVIAATWFEYQRIKIKQKTAD